MKEEKDKAEKLLPELLKEFNANHFQLKRNIHQFKMQFGVDSKNEEFIELALILQDNIYIYQDLINIFMVDCTKNELIAKSYCIEFEEKILNGVFSNNMENFIRESRNYYKKEWDRAKKGK